MSSFDPEQYFDIKRGRAVCPVHGEKDRNLSIRRHPTQPKWQLTCFSHGCDLNSIAEAAGFNPGMVYDNYGEKQDYDPVRTFTSLEEAETYRDTQLVKQNPCVRTTLIDDAGVKHGVACDLARCPDCGPLKFQQLWAGIEETFRSGDHLVYCDSRYDADKLVNRIRQLRVRRGEQYHYLAWHLGGDRFMVLTDAPLENQPVTMLAEIKAKLKHLYLTGLAHVRKSRGWVSVTLARISISASVTGRLRFHQVVSDRELIAEEEERKRRDMVEAMGYDPDIFETLEAWDGTPTDTITAYKLRE